MRPPVDRSRIEQFLQALGREVHGRVRLYLVGGSTVVWMGLRAQTVDIDIAFSAEPAAQSELLDAIRRLKDQLDLNVEQASPADFIPLPPGWEARSPFIAQYGSLDVFHFDPVSSALAKIHRGTAGDFEDVDVLISSGALSVADLRRGYEAIMPRMGRESLKQDPERLRRHFEALMTRIGGR